jgi:hypothetical protein
MQQQRLAELKESRDNIMDTIAKTPSAIVREALANQLDLVLKDIQDSQYLLDTAAERQRRVLIQQAGLERLTSWGQTVTQRELSVEEWREVFTTLNLQVKVFRRGEPERYKAFIGGQPVQGNNGLWQLCLMETSVTSGSPA